jgi:hypothetical protein
VNPKAVFSNLTSSRLPSREQELESIPGFLFFASELIAKGGESWLESLNPVTIKDGDRIAQLVVLGITRAAFQEVAELPTSGRGSGGFGSTGI